MKLVTTEGWIASTCGRGFSLSRRNRSQSLHTPCFPAPPSSLHFPASRLPSSIIRLQSGDPPLKSGQDMNWHTPLTRSSVPVKKPLLIHTTHQLALIVMKGPLGSSVGVAVVICQHVLVGHSPTQRIQISPALTIVFPRCPAFTKLTSDPYIFKDPEQCDKYWTCVKGESKRSLCPDGLVFHPEKPDGEDPCDLKANVPDKCKSRPNLQRPKPGEGSLTESPTRSVIQERAHFGLPTLAVNCRERDTIMPPSIESLYHPCFWIKSQGSRWDGSLLRGLISGM